ncbi:unnamed protein product [Lactuca saligna]|uniref:Uncharacterized protein n=1 Tax=Lactuca saligna TaxID=75948 RepID=A0AA35VQS6_LACSI|nr:unnamed protein product [Lactuca saligna]
MVATASHLRQTDSSSSKLALIKAERDELKVSLLELEREKRSFKECYDLLAREKASLEDNMTALDGLRLEEDIARRKVAYEDLGWLLQKGIVQVVDKIFESNEFALGVKRMKMACLIASVENGKQVIQEQVATRKLIFGEMDATAKHAQAIHAAIKSFMETNFASYLRLGELDIGGLRQMCDDPNSEEGHLEGGSSQVGPSSTPN